MLSGEEIIRQMELGSIVIKPFSKEDVGPNSYYLHITDELIVYDEDVLECKKENKTRKIIIPEEGYVLRPGELYLARSNEYTETIHFVPIMNGRLSLASLGISVHNTASFGDNGFKGTWTIQMSSIKPVRIYPFMKVCQLCYFPVIGDETMYNGKYMGQMETTPSKIYQDEELSEE